MQIERSVDMSTEAGRLACEMAGSKNNLSRRGSGVAGCIRDFVQEKLVGFPWQIIVHDWTGQSYSVGRGTRHWSNQPLQITLRTEAAGRTLLSYDPLGFLDKFLEGEADLSGNLYLLSDIKNHAKFDIAALRMIPNLVRHKSFQNLTRARINVKSHYDIPQEALDAYLDQAYMSYSCAMWEDPSQRERADLLRVGTGENDSFDSLEKAQWRKFKDAADFIRPQPGETLLDVGCGYGGQLAVALDNRPFGKVVGWTISANQVKQGGRILARFDPRRWEINEGDYRQDQRIFDHITSTGMICHVGPRGLVPYLRNIRRRIRPGGRYLHHCMMAPYSRVPLDCQVGIIFNKKYVWPGFHFFTPGTHIRALERNGFEIKKMVNLSEHYAKTTSAWYERMMERQQRMIGVLGDPTFRAWQIFLAGITGSFLNKGIYLYRVYCEAV